TVFPDGRHVLLASRRWPRPTVSTVEGLPPGEEANRDQIDWWAADIRFTLDELVRERRSPRLPFDGRLDRARAGAFGHSFGGIVAAHACQIDRRLKACLNQDGLSAFAPYYLDERGLLQAHDGVEAAAKARVLATVREYTRAFFDKQLKGLPAPLLDKKVTNEFVTAVDVFPRARRPAP